MLSQQLNSELEKSQMDELALLYGYAYLETNLKNYGLARQSSTRFFDSVRAMTSKAPNSGQQAFLQLALSRRDLITGGLAKGDSSTLSAMQDLFQNALETAQTGPK